LTSSPDIASTIEMMQAQGAAPGDILQSLGVSPASFLNPQGSGTPTLSGSSGTGQSLQPLPGEDKASALKRIQGQLPAGSPEHTYLTEQLDLLNSGVVDADSIFADLNRVYATSSSGTQQGGFLSGIGRLISGTPGQQTPFQEFLDDQLGIDPSGGGIFNLFGGEGGGGGIGGLSGGQGAALAALLAKLAYDEAKNRKGVNLTPALTMDRYGGYNMAAANAEAAGEEAPDPRAYGMLARGIIPTLSGGRRPTEAQAALEEQKASGMYRGGPVMHYADGGNVATVDFERLDGKISGPGSEKSDDVPAMLSDGEFVMTGQAVRGAGAFDLENDGGIITLVKTGDENREKGTKLMYNMMNLFSEFAGKPKARMNA
jgi:hypothetical protein